MDYKIPEKVSRVLNLILLGFLLILIRTWYLATVQHEEHLQQSRRPCRRNVVEQVERATICDRFDIPLALNKLQYNAAVCYADLRDIPSVRWEKDAQGKRQRISARVNYIKNLATMLSKELGMNPQKIEDTIHGKASLFPHTPFILKEGLTEKEYYRLRALEKDWVGLCTEKSSKRHYPKGKCASDVIGFMGAISSKEYYAIAEELALLQAYLAEREAGETPMLPKGFHNPYEVYEHLKRLQEKAYTINDSVGKTGVEARFDSELRGFAGKRTYEIDIKGSVVRELPGAKKMIPGQRLTLSLSSELQEFAEQLLAEHEKEREVLDEEGTPSLKAPWIKGGAIVAMQPNTGEIIALASYPRVDLNDFLPSKIHQEPSKRNSNLNKWLENETYVGEIWDGKRFLERDRFDPETKQYYEESLHLSWDKYLESLLSSHSAAKEAMKRITTLGDALLLQIEAEKLLRLSEQTDMRVLFAALYGEFPHRQSRLPLSEEELKKTRTLLETQSDMTTSAKQILDHYLGAVFYNDDKLLLIDLCRLTADSEKFSQELIDKMQHLSLSDSRLLSQAKICLQTFVYEQVKTLFHSIDFQAWREKNFSAFLKEKRKKERESHSYTRPFTEYLDLKEKELFKEFWDASRDILMQCFIMEQKNEHSTSINIYLDRLMPYRNAVSALTKRADLLKNALTPLANDTQRSFLKTMRSFAELDRPLLGRYRGLRHIKGVQLEKHLAAAFYAINGYGYGRSQAFRQSTPLGSVFKLIVVYQALLERYQDLQEKGIGSDSINPLTLIEERKWHPNPNSSDQIFGYTLDGKPITRQYKGGRLPRSHAHGKIDIIGAIEQSSNIYFGLLAAEHIRNPMDLTHTARQFGFGEKSGIEIPGEFAGLLPEDISDNRTNIYAFSIGQHSLIVTPLQTAGMLSAIVNKGKVLKPTIIKQLSEPLCEENLAMRPLFREPLSLIGIDFPLFTSTNAMQKGPKTLSITEPEVKRTLFFPDELRTPIIEGMHRAIRGSRGTARPEIIYSLQENPMWKRHYLELKNEVIGKTGTAEILFKQSLDAETEAKIHNHIWFCGATLDASEEPRDQDLVVVVYLRYSEAGGKVAAPLAVEVMKKWREICSK